MGAQLPRAQCADFEKVKASLEKLKSSPDDPDANLAAGRFYCLTRGDFARGLPMLAKGSDPALKAAIIDEATKTEKQLVDPLLQFRNWGEPLPNNWSAVSNGAAFGTDYFSRTAVAKSNILVNAPNETKYYYQDLDGTGVRLNGGNPLRIPGYSERGTKFWGRTDQYGATSNVKETRLESSSIFAANPCRGAKHTGPGIPGQSPGNSKSLFEGHQEKDTGFVHACRGGRYRWVFELVRC